MTDTISVYIDIEGRGQKTRASCWCACYRMMYSWGMVNDNLIPERITKAKIDYNKMMREGILEYQFPAVGKALGMIGRAATAVRDYDLEDWAQRLISYGPHWIATVNNGGADGHILVVYGVDKELEQLRLYNPWNTQNFGTVQKEYWKLEQMQKKLATAPFSVQVWE